MKRADPHQKFVEAIDSRLAEFFDGYVLLGFHAGTEQPVTIRRIPDAKSALALEALLSRFQVSEPPRDGEDCGASVP